eukprot:TRINITY_DN14994_c0_g1_i1.p1 TRINITY_DN14994_c0_g1~~TRINITY_DN14994_c0_g1_i1.p1  ORF type:complete len:186 (-),score=24.95 TRINITY_DN14994_c0_g1_i1:7-564(-)
MFPITSPVAAELSSVRRGAEVEFHFLPFLEFGTSLHKMFLSSLPTKYGFIHFACHDDVSGPQMRRCESCPAGIAFFAGSPELTSKPPHEPALHHGMPDAQRAHDEGTCRPCAYFWSKADGCRQGADCDFCHLCPPEEFRRRKKEKDRRMRAAKKLQDLALDPFQSVEQHSRPSHQDGQPDSLQYQ